MTTTQTDAVHAATAILRAELQRADTLATLLSALTGSGLYALLGQAPGGGSAAVAHHLAAGALLLATVTLLAGVRPRLRGPGWPSWHRLDDHDLTLRITAPGWDEVRALQRLVRRKFGCIRLAVFLAALGVILLGAAHLSSVTW
ncbi:hypothetical protein [Streptomyces mobaraensis]|uniref:Pycsar effector protein domain-containing protein n=1 Tax=Streptomyces mobaraensis TaxID=35621 RepID=A0A5N5WEL9_STRMB|nr:hypothetical protein [Streptomyces mobaraensis]KAB7850157.1 hypothetical protein FRZ00_06045 [Streptomyces mobaraensis]